MIESMRRLLLLSYAFPPDNTAAAARPGQLYDYLPENGYQPLVLASSDGGATHNGDTVYRIPVGAQSATVSLASTLAGLFMRYGAPYNDRLPWVPYAASAAAQLIRARPVQLIYSTSPSLASHFAALWLKSRFGLPWVADFQDPVRDNPFRTRSWLFPYDTLIEHTLFRNADRLIANTDTVAEVWSRRYPQWAQKISVLWNSFDPRETIGPALSPARSYKVLAHVGSMYGERHPTLLLSSIERLHFDSSLLRVKLIGPIDRPIIARLSPRFDHMRQSGILQVDNRRIPREEALQETAEADYLLLLDLNERNASFQVPSKLLDYIRVGKPILAYTPTNSPVERILAQSGIPFVTIAPDASQPIADQKVDEFLRLSAKPHHASPWFENNLSAKTQARTLAGLLNNLLSQPTNAVETA